MINVILKLYKVKRNGFLAEHSLNPAFIATNPTPFFG